ncbi:putative uridine nucleosidase 1 [Liparis tanakae]|uniref:Putative uridine nucleosidase 1 n=1 Tax=Liparis tanakae TaxID=230148 RepID=A0A4Z2GN53_9TELE|nr:putative uridine nucleosidase 1 [Liparis tanakae]
MLSYDVIFMVNMTSPCLLSCLVSGAWIDPADERLDQSERGSSLDVTRKETMARRPVIIDTDCGIDDAQAIMMALAAPDIRVLGVTCVFGNTSVENVCQNVLRVLDVCERQEIPVFRGSGGPLVGARGATADHFGTDGLGDVFKDHDPLWEQKVQKEHAVSALIRLATENRQQARALEHRLGITRTSAP